MTEPRHASSSSGSPAVSGNAGVTRVFGLAIVVLGGVQLLVVLDGTVVALALHRIQAEFGLSDPARNWVIAAYVIAFGGLMLLGGRLGDTFGRKRMFVTGVAGFTLASLGCGLAVDSTMLIAARVLQGASAAVAAPTAMALVATTYAPGKPRNQAFAAFAAMTGLGSVAGLVAGGLLTEVSWRAVFLINIPVGAVLILGALRCIRESQGERRPLDVPGAVFGTLGCSAFAYAINEGPTAGWTSVVVLGGAVVAVSCLAAFIVVERRAANPLLPLRLFGNPNRVAAVLAIFLAGGIVMVMAVYIALYLQDILRYSPTQSGLAVVPFAFGLGGAAAVASNLALRIQPRWLVLLGGGIVVAGCLFASSIADDRPAYFPQIALPVLVIGAGVGLAVIPLTLSVVAGVDAADIGPLTALAQVAQDLGGVASLVVVSAFATSRTLAEGGVTGPAADMNPAQLDALTSGYALAFVSVGGIALLSGAAVLFMRFTPAEVAEGQQAQEAAHSGL